MSVTGAATPSIHEALGELLRTFSPHPLDPTRAFADWGTTYTDAVKFEDGVRGRSWTELPASFLEYHHDALPFLHPRSIGDYLPAYLAVLLRGDPALDALPGFLLGILTRDDPGRFDARFAYLSLEQRRAVARALVALEATWNGS
ncbi:MAG TPA: hypothetical protein VN253_09050, partial [Kofleriaceae bacterium]|nr:hypothetical protein [Kofleriaceae bacterium]